MNKKTWMFGLSRSTSHDYRGEVIRLAMLALDAPDAAGRQLQLQVGIEDLDYAIDTLTKFRARYTRHPFSPQGGRGLYCEVCDAREQDADHPLSSS